MNSSIKIAHVGISGYGETYISALFDAPQRSGFEIVGLVDLYPQRSRRLEEIRQRRIPIFHDMESLYARVQPDLVTIATPIHLHAPHTCFALSHDSNVLCEKPVGATIADANRMLTAEEASDCFAAIGYQWSFSKAVQALKRDIMAGHFGRPIRLKTIACYPRGLSYFNRNDWAGRISTNDGTLVFDSPLNNATSHFLHNMLYILGPARELSATPHAVQAELYRANDIESFDTAAIRCRTHDGAELLFYTTLAVESRVGPVLHYEFEKGAVLYEAINRNGLIARMSDGTVRSYGDPGRDPQAKIWHALDAVREGGGVACGVAGAAAHTNCVAAAHASVPEIQTFPQDLLVTNMLPDGPIQCVSGLPVAMAECFERGVLPSEHGGLSWSAAGADVDMTGAYWPSDQSSDQKTEPVHSGRITKHNQKRIVGGADIAPAVL